MSIDLIAKNSFTKSFLFKAQQLINTFNERFFKDFKKRSCV